MILIAESGSTKTDWRLIDKNKSVQKVQTPGFNPYFQTSQEIIAELEKSLKPFVEEDVENIYYYGTGITDEAKGKVMSDALIHVFPETRATETYSDVVAAARATLGQNAGIACILGTGSNSCFFDGQKIAFQVPPLGFWLGDEGSGGYLGKSLILAYLHKELPQDVRTAFEDKYGVIDRITIIDHAYRQPFPNRYFAAFSEFVSEHRDNDFIKELVRNSFSLFFDKYLVKYPGYQQYDVTFAGSIAHYYADFIREAAAKRNMKTGKIVKSPIDGLVEFYLGSNTK
jgi:glucosamine kinase